MYCPHPVPADDCPIGLVSLEPEAPENGRPICDLRSGQPTITHHTSHITRITHITQHREAQQATNNAITHHTAKLVRATSRMAYIATPHLPQGTERRDKQRTTVTHHNATHARATSHAMHHTHTAPRGTTNDKRHTTTQSHHHTAKHVRATSRIRPSRTQHREAQQTTRAHTHHTRPKKSPCNITRNASHHTHHITQYTTTHDMTAHGEHGTERHNETLTINAAVLHHYRMYIPSKHVHTYAPKIVGPDCLKSDNS